MSTIYDVFCNNQNILDSLAWLRERERGGETQRESEREREREGVYLTFLSPWSHSNRGEGKSGRPDGRQSRAKEQR